MVVATLGVVTFGLGTAAPVSALPAPPSCGAPVVAGAFHTVTCNYTGGEQSFVVPAGVSSLDVVATSGSSVDLGFPIDGVRAEATVPVGPGTRVADGSTLYVEVGGSGSPVGDVAATADGGGYWLAASDGGVFTFGDAVFHGSAGGLALAAPVSAISADPVTGGYWLAAGDGGVFSFDAHFFGSAFGLRLHAPIVMMVVPTSAVGYWLVGGDGGVFTFGAVPFLGSLPGLSHPPASPTVGAQARLAAAG
jgi:hypothetical protein